MRRSDVLNHTTRTRCRSPRGWVVLAGVSGGGGGGGGKSGGEGEGEGEDEGVALRHEVHRRRERLRN